MCTKLLTLLLWTVLALSARGKTPLEGVWQTVQVKQDSGPEGQTVNKAPGIIIFTRQHYCLMLSVSDRTQLADPAKATASELLAAWGPFIANSGTYRLLGKTATLMPKVSKNPGLMKKGQSFSFVIDGDVMTATYSTPRHTGLHMTLKRLE